MAFDTGILLPAVIAGSVSLVVSWLTNRRQTFDLAVRTESEKISSRRDNLQDVYGNSLASVSQLYASLQGLIKLEEAEQRLIRSFPRGEIKSKVDALIPPRRLNSPPIPELDPRSEYEREVDHLSEEYQLKLAVWEQENKLRVSVEIGKESYFREISRLYGESVKWIVILLSLVDNKESTQVLKQRLSSLGDSLKMIGYDSSCTILFMDNAGCLRDLLISIPDMNSDLSLFPSKDLVVEMRDELLFPKRKKNKPQGN